MNDQRKVIYEQRADIMDADTVGDVVDRHARRDGQRDRRRRLPARHLSRAMGRRGAEGAARRDCSTSTPPIDDWLQGRGGRPRDASSERVRELADAAIAEKVGRARAGDLDADREDRSCCRISIITGRSIWRRSMRCARSSTCAPMRRRRRSTNISRRRSRCSSGCSATIREDVTRTIAHAQFQMQAPPPLPELPDFLTTHIDPFTGEDDSADIDAGIARAGHHAAAAAADAAARRRGDRARIRRNGKARSAATRRARAGRAASTSIATARSGVEQV